MTITTNRSKTVMVDRAYHWRPIDQHTPRSQKLQLIHERDGVAMYGTIGAHRDAWTHWAPLPSFAPQYPPRPDVDEWAGLPRQHAVGLLPPPEPDGLSFRAFAKAVGMITGMIALGLSAGWIVEQLR